MPNINKDIVNLLSKNKDLYLLSVGETNVRLLKAYSESLIKIQDEVASVYSTLGSKPSITQLRKFNRLTTIENNMAKEIARLQNTTVNKILKNQIKDNVLQGYYGTGFATEMGTGVKLGFTALDKVSINKAITDNAWIDSMKTHNSKLLGDVKREFEIVLRSNAREEIISGIAKGKSLLDVKTSIAERFGIGLTRAKTIAQTELHKAYMHGQATGMNLALTNSAKLGIKANKL